MSSRKFFDAHQHNLKQIHGQTQKISYSIVHNIPGRIRFRIPRLAKDVEYVNKLKQAIELYIKGTKVRVNPTAASIIISYETSSVSNDQMRLHLIKLIQTVPNLNLPKQAATKFTLAAIFDSLINLINSVRNIHQARNTIQYQQVKVDTWERLLATSETMIKSLKSAIMFILPHKESPSVLKSA